MRTNPLSEIDITSLQSLGKDSETPDPEPPAIVTNDYGTPNLLFSYYITFPPDSSRNAFAAVKNDIQSWHAWELQQAELQVTLQINAKNLPTDDAIASRIKRTNYRAKVIGVLRGGVETWLTVTTDDSSQQIIQVEKESANGAIREMLLSHLVTDSEGGLPAQLSVILNIINGIVATDPNADNQYLLSHASLNFDTAQGAIVSEIKSSWFQITQGDKGESATEITISFADKTFKFNADLWRRQRDEVEDIIKAGEEIRKEMSFQFLVDS